MFCDLVGSTALTARLDPEDMADLIRAFHGAVAAAVARFDGHVAKWLGDGTLIFFGYPAPMKTMPSARRAPALAIVEAVGTLCRERVSRWRYASASPRARGRRRLIGEGAARERGVVGETPNLAARLQDLGRAGQHRVAETTRRLLGSFRAEGAGAQDLKGFGAPVPAWAVVREADNISRFEAFRSDAMTPFVGREQEIALLIARWRRRNAGEGQVVLLSGEAGIGKSRILAELREAIGGEQHQALRYQCSPHHVERRLLSGHRPTPPRGGSGGRRAHATQLDKLEKMVEATGSAYGDIVPALALSSAFRPAADIPRSTCRRPS